MMLICLLVVVVFGWVGHVSVGVCRVMGNGCYLYLMGMCAYVMYSYGCDKL